MSVAGDDGLHAERGRSKPHPEALKRLARLASEPAGAPRAGGVGWDAEEYADVWNHQMEAPLALELARTDGVVALRAAYLAQNHPPPGVRSFTDLLAHPSPSRELLRLVMTFAEAQLSDPDPALPDDLAKGLYNLALLAVKVRGTDAREHQQQAPIGQVELRRRAEWLARQPWLDERSRRLALDAILRLPSGDST
jgi:hypothetical protein